MRFAFFGTPEFACPALKGLAEDARIDIGLVVTQPDSRSGRGQKVSHCPVRELAAEFDLPVHQPVDVNSPASIEVLKASGVGAFLTAAYGQKLSDEVLGLPTAGLALNLHASLLPKCRGASPVHHAILMGETETGVTLMGMTSRMDAGPIYSKKKLAITAEHTAGSLETELSVVARDLMLESIDGLADGSLKPEPQDESQATWARMLKKEDGKIRWDRTAEEIDRQVRGMSPWPGAYTFCPTDRSPARLLVVNGEILDLPSPAMPGTVVAFTSGIEVATRQLVYRIVEVKRSGKRALRAAEFMRGFPLPVGTRLQ